MKGFNIVLVTFVTGLAIAAPLNWFNIPSAGSEVQRIAARVHPWCPSCVINAENKADPPTITPRKEDEEPEEAHSVERRLLWCPGCNIDKKNSTVTETEVESRQVKNEARAKTCPGCVWDSVTDTEGDDEE